MRKNLKYILLLAASFIVLILVEWFRPTPPDWSMSFSKDDKIPFGGFIVFEMLAQIFPGQRVATANLPVYNTLNEAAADRRNYLFITDAFAPDKLDTEKLLNFVATGNTVFIAANRFHGGLADTLKLKTDLHVVFNDSISLNFVNPALKKTADYIYRRQIGTPYFSGFDTLRTTALGVDGKGEINFIKTSFGAGAFFLSTAPLAFTNYNMLYRDNADYVCRAFSYLPVQTTLWDEYYKTGRSQIRTPLRYVLSREPLRDAYYLALAGVLLFIVFAGRRRQRLIPVLAPRTNTTLEFVETVGKLYFQHGDHKNLAEKKSAHFLDEVRSRYYLKTGRLDRELAEKLAEKTGLTTDIVSALFRQIENVRAQPQIAEAELMALNAAIERFHKLSKEDQ